MAEYLNHPITRLWLLLLLATALSWYLGLQSSTIATLAVLAIAITKCRLVIRHYMEVRDAPRWLQLTCDSWLLLNVCMVLSFYYRAPH